MRLEGKTNYHNVFEPHLFTVETTDWRTLSFQPSWEVTDEHEKKNLEWKVDTYYKDLSDFCNPSEWTKLYRMKSNTGTVLFHYFVDPNIKAVIVPPNAIAMEEYERNKWIGEQIQKLLEHLAYKLRYRLLVSITPESAAANGQRILNIIRKEGYYMWPPTEWRGNFVWIHQSTNTGKWIPETRTEPEYMLPPTIH